MDKKRREREKTKKMTEERERAAAAGKENAAEAHGILTARSGGKLARKARRTEWF